MWLQDPEFTTMLEEADVVPWLHLRSKTASLPSPCFRTCPTSSACSTFWMSTWEETPLGDGGRQRDQDRNYDKSI